MKPINPGGNTVRRLLAMFAIIILETSLYNTAAQELPATLSYKLDIKLDYGKEKLTGKCEMIIQNDTDHPLEKIPFLLYRLLSVESVTDEDGNALTWSSKVTNITGWEKLQVNYTELSLGKSLSPGEKTTINITWEGFMYGYSDEGWRYVKDHIARDFTIIRTDGFGYPVVGYPTEDHMMAVVKEKYDYSLNITVPKELIVATGGELLNVTEKDGEKTYSFQSKKPSWRIDMAAAAYLVFEKNGNKAFCFKADSAGAAYMIDALDRSVKTYTDWFGPVKDNRGYTIIEVPAGYGSQADVTSFCMTADNFKGSDNTGIYHEISHLWNAKSLEISPCRVESEGLAQFLQFLLLEQLDKKTDAIAKAAQMYLDDFRKDLKENPGYRDIPMKDYGTANITEYSYTLGMVMFSLFYELSGQENFNKTIRLFYSDHCDKGATIDDFIACCNSCSSFDTDSFFNDWIYTTKAIKQIAGGASYEELRKMYGVKQGAGSREQKTGRAGQ